jgi:hypothetical protein
MCIFCGGQCGGTVDQLLPMGLPVIALFIRKLRGLIGKNRGGLPQGVKASCPEVSHMMRPNDHYLAGSQGNDPKTILSL